VPTRSQSGKRSFCILLSRCLASPSRVSLSESAAVVVVVVVDDDGSTPAGVR